jgi:hypothetical protein
MRKTFEISAPVDAMSRDDPFGNSNKNLVLQDPVRGDASPAPGGAGNQYDQARAGTAD